MLKGGARDAPERHRTLYATIEWSYELLDKREQGLLQSLSVFSGGFSLEAAEEVCCGDLEEDTPKIDRADEYSVMEGVASLLDKSLIRQEGFGVDPHYAMLEMIRDFALMKMKENDREEELRWRHANYFLSLTQEAKDRFEGPDQGIWFERMHNEINNLRSALRWFQQKAQAGKDYSEKATSAGLRMASALVRFWDIHGHLTEGYSWLEEILPLSDTPSRERVDALIGKAWFAMRLAGISGVLQNYDQALTLARSLGYQAGMAQALDGLAFTHQLDGAKDELVQALHAESLQIWRQLGDKRGTASALGPLAHRAAARYAFDEASSLFNESLALFQEVGDQREIAGALWNLGQIELSRGRYEESAALFNKSLALYQDLKDTHGIPTQLRCLAEVERAQGNLDKARTLFEESLQQFRAIGDKSCSTIVLMGLGRVALNSGDPENAYSHIQESLILSREVGDRHKVSQDLTVLGLVSLKQGDHDSALLHFKESLIQAQELDSKEGVAANLEGMAGVFIAQGDYERALQLLSSAASIRNSIGIPVRPVDQRDLDDWSNTITTSLDPSSYKQSKQTGKKLSMEEAIALAIER
jgi:tetratricopeptide (TPR) repeat protein